MSRKIYITVILILFLLPAVSWYYLQSGLNWRKQAQALMNGKQPFPEGQWTDQSGKIFSSEQLTEHITILSLVTCENMDSIRGTLDSLYTLFVKTKKTNFVILNTCKNDHFAMADSLKTGWYVFDCDGHTPLCDSLLVNWPSGKTHALVDRNKIIRSYYRESTREEKRILNEHMVLLLPTERSEQIILKRGTQK